MVQFFKQFDRKSREVERIWFTLGVFLILLIASGIFLIQGFRKEQQAYQWHLDKIRSVLPSQIKELGEVKYTNEGFQKKAVEVFETVMYDRYDPNDSSDRSFLDELTNRFLRILPGSQDKDYERISDEIIEYSRPTIAKGYPIMFHQGLLKLWFAVGIFYLLIIFGLYNLGLDPHIGEPAFNVIDVGFFAVLVQYTGRLESNFLLVYLVSLLFASFDLYFRKDPNKNIFHNLALILGPYIFALVSSVFWATCEPVFTGNVKWQDYTSSWAIPFLVVILALVFFYLAAWYYFKRADHKAIPPTNL